MINFNLYEILLNDSKYKEIIEQVPEEEHEKIKEQIKSFVSNLENGLIRPLVGALSDPEVSKEFKKIQSKKTFKDLINKHG